MNLFIITTLLLLSTNHWFSFAAIGLNPNPFCNPNKWRIDSMVWFNTTNTNIQSSAEYYFINNTVVIVIAGYFYKPLAINYFKGDTIDTPVDVVYFNGTYIIEIVKLDKLTQTYIKWRVNIAKGLVLEKQSLSSLMRRIITTNTIAVLDVSATHATVIDLIGYVTVYTVDLMTGVGSDYLYLLSNGKQVMLGKLSANWTPVTQLYGNDISAAYRVKQNTYKFFANRYHLTAEVNKSTDFRVETHFLSEEPCRPPDPTRQPDTNTVSTVTNDLVTWLPPDLRPGRYYPFATPWPLPTFWPFPTSTTIWPTGTYYYYYGNIIEGFWAAVIMIILLLCVCSACIIGYFACGVLIFRATRPPDPYVPTGYVMQHPIEVPNAAHNPAVQSVSANKQESTSVSNAIRSETNV